MKVCMLISALICIASSKTLPEYLKPISCSKSDPEYEKCVLNGFEAARPYFIKGIPELGFPPLDPLEIPLMTVNRTVNELVSIRAVIKNVKVTGMGKAIIQSLSADPIKGVGEIRLNIPYTQLEMEYSVNGQLLVVPLNSKGFFKGNFSDTAMHIKGSVVRYNKDGEEYFKVGKMNTKITVGDGHIEMIAKNPALQFGANLISGFFNENPRRVMDAVNPIFIATTNDLYRSVMDQILATLPAKEWLP